MAETRLKKFEVYMDCYGYFYNKALLPKDGRIVFCAIVLSTSVADAQRAVTENRARLVENGASLTNVPCIVGVKGVVNYRPDNFFSSQEVLGKEILKSLGRKLVAAQGA